ncbi:ABC transporter permease [Streptomyces sp. HNM0574]|uniref:ABC transporter permease n=1 Tax=Streptomyces sp. HNM0574 TaxID=2714954 RepID=UPI00146DE76A|nr:ABC transporter permease [Streptomyces sp. HNM0574]NLU67468.1 ABC transporter permease [Streptomyces sp. HNM0574]
MSTLDTAAEPRTAAASPSRALTRFLLRLHRPALTHWTIGVLVLAALLLYLGGPLTDDAADAWKQYNSCGLMERCSYDQESILLYKDLYAWTTHLLLAVPLLVAAWAGAALTGRELEQGTAKLLWTQGVSPARWLATKLAVPAVFVTAGTGLLVLLHRTAWNASEGRFDTAKPWYDTATFYANGPVLVALALLGLVVGALAGVALRRAFAGLGAGVLALLLMWGGLHLAMPRLWPAATRTGDLSGGVPGSGLTLSEGYVTSAGERGALLSDCGPNVYGKCAADYDKLGATGFFHEFHPASHHWPLQLVAAALLLAVAAALTLAAFRLLRRRTGTGRPAA